MTWYTGTFMLWCKQVFKTIDQAQSVVIAFCTIQYNNYIMLIDLY